MGSETNIALTSRNLHDGLELLLDLPDDIVSDILALYLDSITLTNKQAIQLGLFSKAIFRRLQKRPILTFDGSELEKNRYNQELDYMYATLRRYNQDDIHLKTFTFKINCCTMFDNVRGYDPDSIHDECIYLATKRSPKTLNLSTSMRATISLPESVYRVESVEDLSLSGWNLRPTTRRIMWPNLKQLCLDSVNMGSMVFENIVGSCPLIENLKVLDCCSSDWNPRVPNLDKLKQVTIQFKNVYWTFEVSASPNLESIACSYLQRSFTSLRQLDQYQNLRTLSLDFCDGMNIALLLTNCDRRFPRLEELYIGNNPCLDKIGLTSPSLKKIRLVNLPWLKWGGFQVPNIVLFEFECYYDEIGKRSILPKLSFMDNRKEWISRITLTYHPSMTLLVKQELKKFTTQCLNGSKVSVDLLEVSYS